MPKSKEMSAWCAAKQRCYNPKNPGYDNYGGRGIGICDRWVDSFRTFLADMGPCPEGLMLERKNNDEWYTPDNCIWATRAEQNRNKRVRVTPEIEAEIKLLRRTTRKTQQQIADLFDIDQTYVSIILKRPDHV